MPPFPSPRLTPDAIFEINLSLALHIPISELGERLTARDVAFYRIYFEKFGTFETLVAKE